ncbi:MAG: YceI family protein [Polyangiales bacterium]
MMKFSGLLVAALALAGASSASIASAQARNFGIDRARTTFTSSAQLETINGISSTASGTFSVDPANLSATSGTITVPVASIGTGIDERDEHLRSPQWLNAAAHPNATFEITSIRGASSLTANQDANLQVVGRFTIHGQTHNVTARVRAKWDGSTGLRLRARFTIELDDYGVSIPSVVQAKVSNEISIQIDIRASVR